MSTTHLHSWRIASRFKWISGRWIVQYECRLCDAHWTARGE